MTDVIDRAARQVRSTTPGQRVIHRLVSAVKTADNGGRVYRTACHRDLPTQRATLTTAPANCTACAEAES